MKKANPIPTNIGEYLKYNPETGVLTWIKKRCNKALIGKEAGTTKEKCRSIMFDGTLYRAHRIAWFLYCGKDAGEMCIDHINGNPLDNRIVNLRLATHFENGQNQKGKGFYYRKDTGKWCSLIKHKGVKYHLGTFDCPLMARLAYEDKKRELCGEFSPV